VSSNRTTTLIAHGKSLLDALDGGYRLAFTIALGSVLIGFVVGLIILKSKGAPPEQAEAVEASETAISETLIAEVL
jgi:hypothetical protein